MKVPQTSEEGVSQEIFLANMNESQLNEYAPPMAVIINNSVSAISARRKICTVIMIAIFALCIILVLLKQLGVLDESGHDGICGDALNHFRSDFDCSRMCDIPMFVDWFGEGKPLLTVFRPSNGNWYIKGKNNTHWGQTMGNLVIQYGKNGDVPVPGDYFGEGRPRVAVWRPSNGNWYIKGKGNNSWSQTSGNTVIQCGTNGDVPVPADYFGEGKLRIAVWRPSNGDWYIKGKGNNSWGQTSGNLAIQCGANGDKPVPADYFNEGTPRIAVWRPSNGNLYIKGKGNNNWYQTSDNTVIQCGTNGDIPVADYFGEGKVRIAV